MRFYLEIFLEMKEDKQEDYYDHPILKGIKSDVSLIIFDQASQCRRFGISLH